MSRRSERGVPLAKISPAFLHSNSTSHTWAFSAIAELIDNAYDPDVKATEIWIDREVIHGKQCLTVVDNGHGMDDDKLLHMLSFGYCEKVEYENVKSHKPIGKYGNGFKSGSMRLAKDALVFTVCRTSASVGLLSQTYLQEIHADSVQVPMVEYSLPKLKLVSEEDRGMLQSILEFSPYSEAEDIKKELENLRKRFTLQTGTKIVLFNLKRNKDSSLELDFDSDPRDIRNPETHERDLTEETSRAVQNETAEHLSSLRAYCSILFLKPRMNIYIREVKVKNKLVAQSLSQTENDKYKPNWLDKSVGITFGFVPKKKQQNMEYGILVYHRNRLIKAYDKVGYQKQPNDRGVGVVAVVHNADFLTPTHNKQDFVPDGKYNALLLALSNKLNDYWDAKTGGGNKGETLSTEEPDWTWACCDSCFKWRRLPDEMKNVELPDKWYCRMNKDAAYNRCDIPEEPHLEGEYDFSRTYVKTPKPKQSRKRTNKESSDFEAMAAEVAAKVAELEEASRKQARLSVPVPRENVSVPALQTANPPFMKQTKQTGKIGQLITPQAAGSSHQRKVAGTGAAISPVPPLVLGLDATRPAGKGMVSTTVAHSPTVTRAETLPWAPATVVRSASVGQPMTRQQGKITSAQLASSTWQTGDLDTDNVLNQIEHAISSTKPELIKAGRAEEETENILLRKKCASLQQQCSMQLAKAGSSGEEETKLTLLKEKQSVLESRCAQLEAELSKSKRQHLDLRRDIHSFLQIAFKGFSCSQEEVETVLKELIHDNKV